MQAEAAAEMAVFDENILLEEYYIHNKHQLRAMLTSNDAALRKL